MRSGSPTTASTAWPVRCGRRTPARHSASPAGCGWGRSGSTTTTPTCPRPSGAATSSPGSAVSSAPRVSTSIARPSTSGTTSTLSRSAGSTAERTEGSMPDRVWDYVIVGGGSAGCALANRLSADPATSVLVLEAGHSDFRIDPFIHMPAALPFPIGSRFYDWKYETEPEPEMNGRRIYHARGKVLGGSSSINGMIFQRGNPMDYERWADDKGMAEWDYLHCLPYFKRMESLLVDGQRRADTWRGGSGPLVLERGPATNPLFGAFFEAAQQAGYHLTDDVNGYRQEGFARFDRNVHDGRRLSAARAYLHPVMDRPNLRVETLAMATRVHFDGKRATGVDYVRGGRAHRSVKAGEVVLCGGAINTPQLLQLSGIGNPEHLEPLGVRMVHALPGVGENLQDHLEVYIQYASKLPVSIAPGLPWHPRPAIGPKGPSPPPAPGPPTPS